jgi:hypothetical protein
MFEAVDMGDVAEGGVQKDEVSWEVIRNIGTLTGYQARAKVDEFMCGIDGGVMEEHSKREARYSYEFWGCGASVGYRGLAACVTVVCVAAAVSTLAKVFWGSLSMCQVS